MAPPETAEPSVALLGVMTKMAVDGPKSVLVIIVNFRCAGLTVDCLRSLGPEIAAYGPARAVVVENCSGDDSAEVLARAIEAEGWGDWASLVVAPRNGGFAAGNNIALAPALASSTPPDLVWLLNPDTVVHPGALRELVGFLGRRPDVGLAGSRLEFPDGRAQNSTFNFPTLLGELEGGLKLGPVTKVLARHAWMRPVVSHECPVDWVAGASLLIRREVFDAVGLLDEGYFMYFEEVDFCYKAAQAGYPCWYIPSSRVIHLVGQSSGVTSYTNYRKRRPRYWFEARRRYFLANHGRFRAVVADVTYALSYATYRVRRLIQRKPDVDPEWLLWDFVRYNFLSPLKLTR